MDRKQIYRAISDIIRKMISFDKIDTDELALVNQTLHSAIENIKGLKYDLKQKSILVEWNDDLSREPTAFENLSDGERVIIGLIIDITRRMCILNPQFGQDVIAKTPCVVLIDELDIHLHPRWQRAVTNGLKRAFPKVQFIVTTHSPQILGELRPKEIILLKSTDTSHPEASYGLTSSQVIEEIMGADERTHDVKNMLEEAFELLERGDLDIARIKLDELKEKAPGIPELTGAEALLHRKKVIGR